MKKIFEKQKIAFAKEPFPSVEVRKERVQKALTMLVDNKDAIAKTMNEDFSNHRSSAATIITEILGVVSHLKHARDNVEMWVKREEKGLDDMFNLARFGAKGWLQYYPKGVVGIMASWNGPIFTLFSPLAGALAAGDRVMIKMPEKTPKTSQCIKELFAKTFQDDEVVAFDGGIDVSKAFSALPFGHLLFTGSREAGKEVMKTAAKTLTPVSLELGGRNPAVVGKGARIDEVVPRIANGRLMNGGQYCVAPNHVFVPREEMEDFVTNWKEAVAKLYPTVMENNEYIPLIDQEAFKRVKGYIDEASKAGCVVHQHTPDGKGSEGEPPFLIPPTLIVEPGGNLKVSQEEIFGPVLPIYAYDSLEDVTAKIRAQDNPLCGYYFGEDEEEREQFLSTTLTSGVTYNDAMFQMSVDGLPFGGVGASGMGFYHGVYGFRTFSKERAIFLQSGVDMVSAGQRPPFRMGPTLMIQMGMINAR